MHAHAGVHGSRPTVRDPRKPLALNPGTPRPRQAHCKSRRLATQRHCQAPDCGFDLRLGEGREAELLHTCQLEYRHGAHEFLRLNLEALGRRGTLFNQRCVLLGHPIHLADGVSDLLDAMALFNGCRCDL